MLHMLRLIRVIYLVLLLSASSWADENTSAPADTSGADASQLHQDVETLLQKVQRSKGEADSAMAHFNSNESQNKRQDENARLQKFLEPQTGFTPNEASPAFAQDKVYVFLSGSMPDEAVHIYIAQAAQDSSGRIIPVFYGLPGGLDNKRAAGSYLAQMMKERLDCKDVQGQICPRIKIRIKVNPDLFTLYAITQVPTVIYTDGENSWSASGDATLGFLLEKINAEAHSSFLAEEMKKIGGVDEQPATEKE